MPESDDRGSEHDEASSTEVTPDMELNSETPVTEMWNSYWSDVRNERLLAAKSLLELSPTVQRDVAQWLRTEKEPWFDDEGNEISETDFINLDWEGWAAEFTANGAPFSATENNLARLVAALAADVPLNLVQVLEYTGSWERQVWKVLVEWGTGGNNLELPGRATVVANPKSRNPTARTTP